MQEEFECPAEETAEERRGDGEQVSRFKVPPNIQAEILSEKRTDEDPV